MKNIRDMVLLKQKKKNGNKNILQIGLENYRQVILLPCTDFVTLGQIKPFLL